MTISAAAPSEICDALPAVMVPSFANAGRRPESESVVVSGRTPSSSSTITGSPLRWGTGTGTISSARRPSFIAAAARSWLRAASSSCSSRVMLPKLCVYCSVPAPMWIASNAHHRPSLISESTSSPLPMRYPARAFGSRYGAPVIDSMPPATTTSASPLWIIWSARYSALTPERHTLLIVIAGTLIGMPAFAAA